ncbi:hypothetical protein Hbal_2177 [Hirschia baltica ATCC 49814]|uniref:Uncharacterized protein n=1 Tax=Hirschia baltica (strain ATCC 49814 / DSM 5838 / IFAM 1418) TaxID=582402 RepID=C6XM26_HIRBI|nr:hypothetical protein Hbal_2177 [Hirschia baltica ATCC 49814]
MNDLISASATNEYSDAIYQNSLLKDSTITL